MKMMGESDNIGDAGMLGLPGVIILVTWPVQCDLSSQARLRLTHAEETLKVTHHPASSLARAGAKVP